MTAPASWTSPAPEAAPPLVVRPDRSAARRWLTLILVLNGLLFAFSLAVGLWAASTSSGAIGGLPFAITLTGAVFQMVFHAFAYGRMLGAETLAVIGPDGVRGLTPRWDVQLLPWSSIASVTGSWNSVVVKPVPGAGSKLVIPTRATTSDSATVRAAATYFSGGRL